ncbi:MAG: hypothetical protein Q4D91_09195 [Lautropia sp.]|nr:hypothetical protein [Lautropia sp.]
MKIRVTWVFMAAAIATMLGCHDQEHHHKEGGSHETKSYKLGKYYKPCPGGLYENGTLVPKESKVHAREVFVSEGILVRRRS